MTACVDRDIRVVMTAPSGVEQGGVATYCSELERAAGGCITLVGVGSRGPAERWWARLPRLVLDAVKLAVAIETIRPHVVQLSPSLDARSACRDGLHLAIARAMRHRPVIFIHGWPPKSDEWLAARGQWLARALMNRSSAVVVLASAYREQLHRWGVDVPVHLESTLVPQDVLEVFGDTRPFAANEPTSRVTVLVLGRVRPSKGIWTAVNAVEMARSQGRDIRLVIAGDGPLLPQVQEKASTLERSWLTCLGTVRGSAKWLALNGADILLMPSPSEGMPVALLEGMAAGLPIVTTRVGGVADFFVDGTMGFSCPANDVRAMADAIAGLCENRKQREAIGRANRVYALDHFTAETVWARLRDIYTGCMDRGDARDWRSTATSEHAER